jgi:hypothetical protein
MIDNFIQISHLLKFDMLEDFYFVQVLQRSKENPDLGKNNHLVKAYYIYSADGLLRRKEEITKLCEVFNARAYIHLNRRNARTIALELLSDIADNIKSGHLQTLYNSYNSVCGKFQGESRDKKTWVVDIDTKDNKEIIEVLKGIDSIRQYSGQEVSFNDHHLIETKNGYHIITAPFNSKLFADQFPDIEVHKNNPTILYV